MGGTRARVGYFLSALSGVVVGALLLGGVSYAANGGSFLLGRSNAATATSTLTNTAGVPLSLKAKAGSAPLAVNSRTKVAGLNSDLLDGLDQSAFLRTTGTAADAAALQGKNLAGVVAAVQSSPVLTFARTAAAQTSGSVDSDVLAAGFMGAVAGTVTYDCNPGASNYIVLVSTGSLGAGNFFTAYSQPLTQCGTAVTIPRSALYAAPGTRVSLSVGAYLGVTQVGAPDLTFSLGLYPSNGGI